MMVKLELTEPERALLLEVLKDRLGTVREEIYHSTTFEFTEQLKEKEKALRQLIDKLEKAAQSEGG